MTNQHLGTAPRQSIFTVETGSGYRLEFTSRGFVDDDADTYAMEILSIAGHVFNDVYSQPFEEKVVEMLRHKFEALLEDEGKVSEYDLGWSAGRQAALLEAEQTSFALGVEAGHAEALEADEVLVGKFLKVTDTYGGHGFPVGTKVRVVWVDDDGNDDETNWLATTREDERDWENEWESGVTAWVGPVNTEPWVDSPSEG